MNKNEIIELIKNHRDSFVQIIKAKNKEFYIKINNDFNGKSFSEKIYKYICSDNENLGLCYRCKEPTMFLSFQTGYRKYCSPKCANIDSIPKRIVNRPRSLRYWVEKNCKGCGQLFWSLISRDAQFCSIKCSSSITSNDSDRISKIRKTKLERYGNETYVNPEKAKRTCLERYGVDNVNKSPEIIKKIKQSTREKYGVDWSWQSEEIKNKIKESNIKKYGVEYPMRAQCVKDKMMGIFLDKYGVNNPFQSSIIKDKIREGYKKKFGVEYPSQIEEVRKKISEAVMKTNYKLLCSSQRVIDNIEILFTEDEYKGARAEFIYKVKCKKCGNIFEDHFDGNGHPRCMICYPSMIMYSHAEKEIVSFVKSLLPPTENIIERDRSLLGNRELDIYIPSKNIAIEYNGLFWHSETNGKSKVYHLDKSERCLQKGIQLIHIFEDEWINNSELVKLKLSYILHSCQDKIYARECNIEEISSKHTKLFMNKYHIQGGYTTSINIGLFCNNDLVAAMTFGKPRVSLGNKTSVSDEYELVRYATSKTVVGGASKLFSYFIKKYNPHKITSYADRRWSCGKLYDILGFSFKGNTDPNYWYLKPGRPIRYHRFGFRKSILSQKIDIFDPQLTEWENMKLNGWDRIWDCGNLKYEWMKEK